MIVNAMLIGEAINPFRSSYLSCKKFQNSYFILEITQRMRQQICSNSLFQFF